MTEAREKYEIFVNGTPKHWDKDTISYAEVVDLAFPPPHNPNAIFTVQYSHGPQGNHQGTMVGGQLVSIKIGMRFDVTQTIQS